LRADKARRAPPARPRAGGARHGRPRHRCGRGHRRPGRARPSSPDLDRKRTAVTNPKRRNSMTLSSTAARGARLAVAGLVAGLSAALVLLFSGGHASAHDASMTTRGEVSAKTVALETAMDKLWEDHVTWTRMVIVSFAAG